MSEWAAAELKPGAAGHDHRVEIEDVEVAGDLALARLHARDVLGNDAREVFTFVRSDEGWRITSKSWATVG